MEKIFYADKTEYSSVLALKKILSEYYGIENATILRTEHGKPYMENGPYFSVTHTKNRMYIIVAEQPIGIDSESRSRLPFYETIVNKFSEDEQREIQSPQEFLKHWVAKESAIKFLGSTLALDLKNFTYVDGKLTYKNEVFLAQLSFLTHEDYLLCICGANFYENVEFIAV